MRKLTSHVACKFIMNYKDLSDCMVRGYVQKLVQIFILSIMLTMSESMHTGYGSVRHECGLLGTSV